MDIVCDEVLPKLNRKQLFHFVERLAATIVTLQASDMVATGGQSTGELLTTEERIEINALMLLERAAMLLPDLAIRLEEDVEKEIGERK